MTFPPCLRCVLLVALATALRAEEKPAGDPAKSAHWLVDAMAEKTADSREDTNSGASPGDRRSPAMASWADAKPDAGTANPLSSYLATWMTPRDLEILKIKSADANPVGGRTVDEQNRTGTRGPAINLRTNPYLDAAEPTIAPVANVPQNTPPAKSLVVAPPGEKKDAAPGKTAGPPADLLKAQDDAKYFPQLKRF